MIALVPVVVVVNDGEHSLCSAIEKAGISSAVCAVVRVDSGDMRVA